MKRYKVKREWFCVTHNVVEAENTEEAIRLTEFEAIDEATRNLSELSLIVEETD